MPQFSDRGAERWPHGTAMLSGQERAIAIEQVATVANMDTASPTSALTTSNALH